MENTVKLIIADDHQLVRQGLAALLGALDFVDLIGEASNGQQLLSLLKSGKKPDVILLDVDMPVMNGLETLEHLSRDAFGVKVIMMTMLNDRAVIQDAVGKGARGFLFKNASVSELSDAILKVSQGAMYLSSEVSMTLLQPETQQVKNAAVQQLSEREIEVLRLIAEGLSSTEIGEQLFISPRTVDTHRNNLIHKLGVNGIAGLVRFALQNGLA
ncbi:MAG: response regulator transcription factor [Saprospiraceae bacterium]|nr:response regulator transcription factor [Saprospiraceae bacterium]